MGHGRRLAGPARCRLIICSEFARRRDYHFSLATNFRGESHRRSAR